MRNFSCFLSEPKARGLLFRKVRKKWWHRRPARASDAAITAARPAKFFIVSDEPRAHELLLGNPFYCKAPALLRSRLILRASWLWPSGAWHQGCVPKLELGNERKRFGGCGSPRAKRRPLPPLGNDEPLGGDTGWGWQGTGHRLEACATVAPKNFTPSILVGAPHGRLDSKIGCF